VSVGVECRLRVWVGVEKPTGFASSEWVVYGKLKVIPVTVSFS
jgi:hypothetical protein